MQHPQVMHPGPLRISFENRLDRRALPTVLIAADPLRPQQVLPSKMLVCRVCFRLKVLIHAAQS